jgi:polyketide biosynthesis enoyl-CoA hydratase PksI
MYARERPMSNAISVEHHERESGLLVLRMQDTVGRNTFTDGFVDELSDALVEVGKDRSCKAVLVTGLPDVFCAGAAKQSLLSLCEGELEVKDLVLSELMLQVPVPTIAAMEGAALGGGLVLALCCDIMLMNEKRMYGANFTNMGFTPGMGCTRLIQALVGEYVANEMLYRGRLFKGREFRDRSLVNYVLRGDQILDKATDIAVDICEKPRRTLEILKYSLNLNKRQMLAEARVHEDFMHRISFAQPEVKEMVSRLYNDRAT